MGSLTALTFDILLALADEDRHGYGIIKEIEERTGAGSAPSTGAMYLALRRMVADGLITDTDGPESTDGRRRYYTRTDTGRRRAEAESARLERLVSAARAKDLLVGEGA